MMTMSLPLLWASIFIPFIAALITIVLGENLDKKTLAAINSGSLLLSALIILYSYITYGIKGLAFDPVIFTVDGLGTFALSMDAMVFLASFSIALVTAIVAVYSLPYMDHRFEEMRGKGERVPGWRTYYFLYTLFALSMIGTVMSTNMIEFYLFLELTLIPSFLLIAFYGYGDRVKIAILYLIWTHVGALLFLIGTLALGQSVGFDFISLDKGFLVGLGENLGTIASTVALLLIIGLAVKMAVLGLHIWLPYAHAEAPTPISALLSPNLIGIGGVMMFRIVYVLFPATFAGLSDILYVWALATMIYGGLMALSQTDFKRLLAYSSVSQMGYMLLGLASVSVFGVAGTMLHYMVHAFGKAILFAVAGILIANLHGLRDITKMGGLATKMPYTAALALLGFMHITGIPPTSGLWSEYLIIRGAVEKTLAQGLSWYVGTALALLLGIGLSTAYAFLTMKRVFYGELKEELSSAKEAERSYWAPLIVLAALGILTFILASPIIDPLVSQIQAVMRGV